MNEQYSEPVKVYLDSDIKETYIIGSETSAKTPVKFELMQKDDLPLGTIKIDGEENDGKVHAYSVGQSVSLRYRVPDGYTFNNWIFTDTDGNLIDSKDLSISLSDEEITGNIVLLTLTIDNYMAEQIIVTPDISENLAITKFNLDDEEKIYERDSNIIITFNKPLSTECKDNIIIKIPGLSKDKSVADYFEPAELNQNVLTIRAKNSSIEELLPLGVDGTNTISVIIPASGVFYEDQTGVKVGMESDFNCSYKIDSKTSKHSTIKFILDSRFNKGTLKVNGVTSNHEAAVYYMGDVINLAYSLSKDEIEDYFLKNWKVTRTYSIEEDTEEQIEDVRLDKLDTINFDASFKDSTTETGLPIYSIEIKVIDSVDGLITIMPEIGYVEDVEILIDGEHGKFSPAKGKNKYKLGKSYHLEFEPDSDYGFVRWQIINSKTGQEITDYRNYITSYNLDNEKADFIVIEKPDEDDMELVFKPLVCERPQIISKSPYSVIVNKDTSVQIMFDYEMSINSIYYSEREMDDLRELVTDSLFKKFLDPVIIDNEERYYGYERNDGSYVYKNISITNNRTGENLVQYFEPPVFENKNRILTLNVKRVGADNNVAIPQYSQILITIDKNVFYEIDNKPVSMYKAEKWMYQVNNKIDGVGPAFDKLPEIKLDKNITTKLNLLENVPGMGESSITWEQLPYYDVDNFELAFDVRDGVGESGLASSFTLECQQIYNSNYVAVTNGKKTLVNIDYDFVNENATTQFVGNCSQLGEQLESGIYKVKVIVRDKCANETQYPPVHQANDPEPEKFIYLLIDKTGPDITRPELTFENVREEGVIKPVWSASRSPDYRYAKIKCCYLNPVTNQYNSIPEYPKTINKDDDTKFTDLLNGTKYRFDVYYYDWKDNYTNIYYYYENTIPAKPKSVTVSTAYGTSATITTTKPDDGYCTNTKVYYKTTDSSTWTLGGTTSGADGSVTINNLARGKIYEFDVHSYDSASGKESLSYKTSADSYPTFTTVPDAAIVSKVDYNNAQNSLKVDYVLPSTGNYDGIKILYSKKADFATYSTISLTKAQANGTYTITGLDAGTKYYVKAVSWYRNENNKTESAYKSAYTMPEKVYSYNCDLYVDDAWYNYVDLCWDNSPANGEYDEFEIYYKHKSDSSYTKIATVDSDTFWYEIGEDYDRTELVAGNCYDFKVVTVINDKDNNVSVRNTNYAATLRHYMAPKAPSNVAAEKLSDSSFKVTWAKPSIGNFTGYNLIYGKNSYIFSSENTTVNITNKDTTTYTVSGVSKDYYYIWVEAYVAESSGATNKKPDNYSYGSTRCSLALDAVSGLTINPHSSYPTTGFTLSWTIPSNTANYDGIEIWRKLNSASDSSYSKITTLSKTATSYSNTGLSVNTKYDYKVVTYKGSSSTASGAVKAENVITKTTMSSAVSGLSATVQSHNKVTLSWTNPDSANYNEIKIYRGTTLVKTLSKGTTSYDVTGLSGGTSYTFYVKTTNSEGVVSNSYASGLTRRTQVAPVTNLSYSATTQTSKTLTWTNPSGNYTGVKVYVKLSGYSDSYYSLKATLTGKQTSYEVTGLSAGNTYVFKVESYYSTDSTNTATLTQYTAPPAVTNYKFTSRTGTYGNVLNFSWTNPSSSNYEYVNLRYRKVSAGTSASYNTSKQTKGNTSGSLTLDAGWRWEVYAETYYHGFTTASTSLYNVTQPSNPYNISVSSEHTQVKVSWTVPSGEQNYYKVKYRRKGTSSWNYSDWLRGNTISSWTTQSLKDGQLYEFTVYSNLDFSSESSGGYEELNSSNFNATSGVQYYAPPAKIKTIEIGSSSYWQITITAGGNSLDEWLNSIDGIKYYAGATEYSATLETTNKYGERRFRIPMSVAPKGTLVTIMPYHNRNTNHSEWNGMNGSYTSLTLGQPFQFYIETTNITDPDAP